MNFTIVENYEVSVDYEEFKKDFMSMEYTNIELRKKYDLSPNKYKEYSKKVCTDLGISRKPKAIPKNPIKSIEANGQFISMHRNKWRVGKSFGSSTYLYRGSYDSLEEAKVVRDYMVRNEWSKEIYARIKKSIFRKRPFEHEEKVFSEFENDYIQGMQSHDLIEKYGVTSTNYNRLSRRIKDKLGIAYKPVGAINV